MVHWLLNPWVLAGAGSLTAYALYKKSQDQGERIREAKVELLEQQRTIDRLRAELGRERHKNQQRHEAGGPY